MGDDWQHVKASEVQPGDRVRIGGGTEMTASRVEHPFMGRDSLVAFIEDTPERWFKQPVPADADVEVRPGGGAGSTAAV